MIQAILRKAPGHYLPLHDKSGSSKYSDEAAHENEPRLAVPSGEVI